MTSDPILARREAHGDGNLVLEDDLRIVGKAGIITENLALAKFIGGSGGNDILNGTPVADTINGLAGNDTLTGLGGNDTLNGDGGNDKLDGGSGADLMIGGSGNDSYVVQHAGDHIVENPGGGTDTVTSYLGSSIFTLPANVENLVLGGTHNISGIGNSLNNLMTGNSGHNHLFGGSGSDTLVGGGGNDTLDGGGGADLMIGGSGNDSYVVQHAGDHIVENPGGGIDTVTSYLASSTFTLPDNVENLILGGSGNLNGIGNSLDNEMTGNVGDNSLNGGGGDDFIRGNEGRDTLDGGNGNDTLIGPDGAEDAGGMFIGGAGNDRLVGTDDGPDTFIGGPGNDTMSGGVNTAPPEFAFDNAYVFSLAAPFGSDVIFDAEHMVLHFEDVVDADGNSVLDLDDLNASITSVADDGFSTGSAFISFNNGSQIEIELAGHGTTDSLDDILDPTSQIVIAG